MGGMGDVTLSALLRNVRLRLDAAGIPSSEFETGMIVGHVLGLKRSEIYSLADRRVTPEEAAVVMGLVDLRMGRLPLQYLLGECEFMSLPFRMQEGVFIARPETEILAETVIKRVEAGGKPVRRVLDLATGSGVIGISLARYLKPDLVVGTDISRDAVEIARANAILNQVEAAVQFVVGDRLDPLRQGWATGFDVVVCNPPYVETDEIPGLQPEIRVFEPLVALDGGPDGLRFIDGILPGIASILNEGGLVAFEIGATQGPRVKALFEQAGLAGVEVVKDLARLDRIVLGRRS